MNPRLQRDHAELMLELGDAEAAEAALRTAIALAPDYADAFAALAALQAGRGRFEAAARLQQKVVELQPHDAAAVERLREYQARQAAAPPDPSEVDAPAATPAVEPAAPASAVEPAAGGATADAREATADARDATADARDATADARDDATDPRGERPAWLQALGALDLDALAAELAQRGFAVARGVLQADELDLLRRLAAGGDGVDREEQLDGDAGRCRWRHFLLPPPLPIAALRQALYEPAAALANAQLQRLGEPPALPPRFSQWRGARLGRSEARLVALPAGGFTPPVHAPDRRAFPLRAVVDLGSGIFAADTAAADTAAAGTVAAATVAVLDQRPGRKQRSASARTRPGDVVFCSCRTRLSAIAGVFGLQLVSCRLGPVATPRLLLELDFDGR